jgi:hypothetical protein
VDLPHNIETIGMINNPKLCFIPVNLCTADLHFLSGYDIILMNGFIDVMQYPIVMLRSVLSWSRGYVVLHRQEITDGASFVKKNSSYTGFTYHSVLNYMVLQDLIASFAFEILETVPAGHDGNWYSFLLRKQ